jgi:hypothetical protein
MTEKFELAPQVRTDALTPYVEIVVAALGAEDCLVTDDSTVHDLALRFMGHVPGAVVQTRFGPRRRGRFEVDQSIIDAAADKLGLVLLPSDRIADVALALKNKQVG